MIQTVLVYLLLLIFMFILTLKKSKIKILGIELPIFVALLLYSIVFGIRYGVGKDYFAYLDAYFEYQRYDNLETTFEIGFNYISRLFSVSKLHYSFYFGVLAFIQLYFVLLSYKNRREIVPYIIVSLILSCTFLSWMNGIRQNIAFVFFIYSLRYILEKKPIPFFSLIFIATMFHNSAIILALIYPIFAYRKTSFINNRPIQLILLFGAVFISGRFNESFFESFGFVVNLLEYDHYSEFTAEGYDLSIGLGYFILLTINVVLISDSNKLKEHFKDSTFHIIYDLFFFGCLWNYIFFGSIPLTRPNYYFYGFSFLVTAHSLLYHLDEVKRGKSPVKLGFLLLLLSSVFVAYLSSYEVNDFKYMFFWES